MSEPVTEPQERFSQAQPIVAETRPELPTPEELQRKEMHGIIHRITRLRLVLIPVAVLFLTLVVLFDTASWKAWMLGIVVGLLTLLALFDLRRLHRREPGDVIVDPAIAVFLQTGLIWMTGALESPLVVIYVPLTLLSGVALGDSRERYLLLGLASILLWTMSLTALLGLVPRTVPSFLDLGPGFYDRPTYVITKTAVLNLVMVVASFAGLAIHRTIRRVLKGAIEAREQALELVLERNRELHQLSGAIAHELKNPLASISGLVQLLGRQHAPDAEEREAARLEVLRAEVARMRNTLDEMLNYSRPLGPLSLQEVALPRLIAELSALHEGLAAARELAIEPPAGAETIGVRGDPRKLKQALVNLLQNALEAAPRGSAVSWIVRALEAGAQVEVGVRDRGPGLPSEILERGPRVGATTKPAGSGIGLAVARAIAEQHGGSLRLENLESGGCQALLRLPAHPPERSDP